VRPEPFVLEPILKPKVWGGRRLAQLGKPLPDGDEPIGESWELADLAATSVDGGGGGGRTRSSPRDRRPGGRSAKPELNSAMRCSAAPGLPPTAASRCW